MQESRGRPIAELLACPRLAELGAPLRAALVEAAAAGGADGGWAAEWDGGWATGAGYFGHVESETRIEEFRVWFPMGPITLCTQRDDAALSNLYLHGISLVAALRSGWQPGRRSGWRR